MKKLFTILFAFVITAMFVSTGFTAPKKAAAAKADDSCVKTCNDDSAKCKTEAGKDKKEAKAKNAACAKTLADCKKACADTKSAEKPAEKPAKGKK